MDDSQLFASPTLKMSHTYLIGIVISLVCITLVMAYSIFAIKSEAELVEKIYQHPFTVSTNVLEADAHLVAMHRYMKDVVIARDSDSLQSASNLVAENEIEVLRHLSIAKSNFLGDVDQFQHVIDAVIEWRSIRSEVIDLSRNKQYKEAADITLNKGADYVRYLNSEMANLVDFARNKATEFLQQSESDSNINIRILLTIYLIVIILVTMSFYFMYRLIKSSESSILNSEYRYRSIFDNVSAGIWDEDFSEVYLALENLRQSGVKDLDQYLTENPEKLTTIAEKIIVRNVNQASLEIFDADSKETLISSLANTFGEGAMDVFKESLLAYWDTKPFFSSKVNYVSLNGRQIIARISIPIPKSLSESYFVPVLIEDITKSEEMTARLNQLANVFTEANEGICIVSSEAKIINVNETFIKMTGYSREEIIGQNPRFLKSGRQDEQFYQDMWEKLLRDGNWKGEIWNRKKDGTVYPQILTISSVYNSEGELLNYVGLCSDITHIKAHEYELEHLAQYDALTELPNRVLLLDRLKQSIAQVDRNAGSLAVCFIDLDGFKAINDNYGHYNGDELLIAVTKRMLSTIREIDTLARIGGDEFVVIFNEVNDRKSLDVMLKRLLNEIAKPFDLGKIDVIVSASIGVAIYSSNDLITPDELIRQSDQTMYEAKLAGRNMYRYFDKDNNTAISERFNLVAEIETAINSDQFILYYQPKINLLTGEVIGAEALIRWNHPERGLLFPDEFLPIIEDDLIIISIGEWVTKTALQQLRYFIKQGITIPISVNIGAVQIAQVNFIERLTEILNQFPDVRNELLELEILESVSFNDIESVSTVIKQANQLGVKFSIDDFGTGYSSLVYLQNLSVDTLKIDQGFVRNMLDNPDDEAILSSVLNLANNLNMNAIAEGVETRKHAEILIKLGCIYGQGYAISRPIAPTDFEQWLHRWQPVADWTTERHPPIMG